MFEVTNLPPAVGDMALKSAVVGGVVGTQG